MKKLFYFLPVMVFLMASCGGATRQDATQTETAQGTELAADEQAFLDNLASLCGKSFTGREVYMQPGRESWADKNLVMHVTVCEKTHVHIPFHLDDDHSRTWMFFNEDGRLRFRHDHRHEDGTPEDLTLYGGYADGNGNAFMQFFPADQYTIDLLVDTLGRQWNVVLDEDLTNFSYRLLYHGEIVFRADFDLTSPL